MALKVNILYVEDTHLDQKLTTTWLKKLAPHFEVSLADNQASAKEILQKSSFDLVLLDYHLPDGDGISLRNGS